VIGRRLFDVANGWDGRPPVGEAVFVVTHQAPIDWDFPEAPFTFVTDGVESAVRQAKSFAADKDVSVSAGNIGQQAFEAGLVDEVRVDLVGVVLGAGKRYFGDYAGSPLLLENPQVVEGDGVTHLHYRLRKP
jgi:dihydrofolate reductase